MRQLTHRQQKAQDRDVPLWAYVVASVLFVMFFTGALLGALEGLRSIADRRNTFHYNELRREQAIKIHGGK